MQRVGQAPVTGEAGEYEAARRRLGDWAGSGVGAACLGVGVAVAAVAEFGAHPDAEDDTGAGLAGNDLSDRAAKDTG